MRSLLGGATALLKMSMLESLESVESGKSFGNGEFQVAYKYNVGAFAKIPTLKSYLENARSCRTRADIHSTTHDATCRRAYQGGEGAKGQDNLP